MIDLLVIAFAIGFVGAIGVKTGLLVVDYEIAFFEWLERKLKVIVSHD